MNEDKQRLYGEILDLRVRSNLNSQQYIRNSVLSNNIQTFKNRDDKIDGYVIWANVNRSSVSQIDRFGLMPRYPYEWNEGNITLILDIFLVQNRGTKLARKSFLSFLRTRKTIAYVKRKNFRIVVRSGSHYKTISLKLRNKI